MPAEKSTWVWKIESTPRSCQGISFSFSIRIINKALLSNSLSPASVSRWPFRRDLYQRCSVDALETCVLCVSSLELCVAYLHATPRRPRVFLFIIDFVVDSVTECVFIAVAWIWTVWTSVTQEREFNKICSFFIQTMAMIIIHVPWYFSSNFLYHKV